MHLRRSRGQHLLAEHLTSVRRGRRRDALFCRRDFARKGTGWILAVLDWNQRLAGCAIEQVNETLLARLNDCIDRLAIMLQCDKNRRGGKIAVPKIVTHPLKVPDSLSGFGIEGNQAIGEQIITDTVCSV